MALKPPRQSDPTPLSEDPSEGNPTTPKSKKGLFYFLLFGPIPFGVIGLLCIFHPLPYSGSGGGYRTPAFSFSYDASQTVGFGIFFLLIALGLSTLGWRIFRK